MSTPSIAAHARRALGGPLLLLAFAASAAAAPAPGDPRLAAASRGSRGGWITVRLAGTPAEIGYQHGRLLAPEIADTLAVARLELVHDTKHDWAFLRKAAETVFWPRVDAEYREELTGIVEGANAGGTKADLWDVVVLNAALEIGYYTAVLDGGTKSAAPDKCSAFVATGRFTRDGRPVIAHNNWSGYLDGARWNVVFDIRPARGQRILMDGYPGFIHSGDDFGVNSAGIAITETTITGFKGFDPRGVPEFVRARKAMQYASSIDDFDRIMRDGNNGGYANAWLVADENTGEIARLELGLRNVTLERTKDGYFVGTNFPVSPKLATEETSFKLADPGLSANARRVRAEQLMKQNEGRRRPRGREGLPLRPLRRSREEGGCPERAHAVRPRGPVAARHGRLVRAVRAGGHRTGEGRGRGDGEADVVRGGDGPPLRPRLPRGGAPREAPGARVDEAAAARPRRAALDGVHRRREVERATASRGGGTRRSSRPPARSRSARRAGSPTTTRARAGA